MAAMQKCPDDHPMMIAWKKYQATEDYKTSRHWALTIQPMIQVGDPEAERKRYSLMPIDRREQHVDGALWAAFITGWEMACNQPDREEVQQAR